MGQLVSPPNLELHGGAGSMKEAEVDMASLEPLAPWVPQGLSKLRGPFPGLRVTSTAGLWGNHSKPQRLPPGAPSVT